MGSKWVPRASTLTAGTDASKSKLDVAIHGHPGTISALNARAGSMALARHFVAQSDLFDAAGRVPA